MPDPEGASARVSSAEAPSLDLIFEVLSVRERRYALYYLRDRPDGVATVEEVVDHVLALEVDRVDESDGNGEFGRRRSLSTTFRHAHLPKLVAVGALEYDGRSETVRYRRQPSLDEWLEHARYKER
ncbi:hypothetical protein [Halovivax sp.]|uniref:DUF7344 domain-containing protein n=1 Tax=Halovivax sp. TaxID=1935978 RepID=UPI0025BAAC96|nr:hypothetical protein [Halovivax sp.]